MEHRNFDDKSAVSIEDALEYVGTGRFQIMLAIIGGIVVLSSYFAIGVITFVMPAAHCDLNLNYEDRGNLASISFIGLIISCHLWGFLSDTLGRRYILIRCLFCDAMLYFVTALSPNYYVILITRLFNGIASCGGVVSIYAYVGEFQTEKFRSTALMISSLIGVFSNPLLAGMAWLIIPGKWQLDLYPGLTFKSWRLYYAVCGLPSLISTIFLFFMPESPKYLLVKGKNKNVIGILQRMYRTNHKKSDEFPIKDVKLNEEERCCKLDGNKNKVFAVVQLLWDQTVPLLKKPYRFNFTIICVALFACFFCNNGMFVWMPEAINRMELYKNSTQKDEGSFCEILENSYSSNNIKEKFLDILLKGTNNSTIRNRSLNTKESVCDDEVNTTVYLCYLIMGSCLITVWFLITAVVKHVNKKYILLLLTACNLIASISMQWSNAVILMPVKASSMIVFTAGIFPILYSVVVDLFPTNIRAMAGCLTLMASRLGSVVTHEVNGFLIQSHCYALTWHYIVLAAVCLLSVVLLPSSPPKQSSSSNTK